MILRSWMFLKNGPQIEYLSLSLVDYKRKVIATAHLYEDNMWSVILSLFSLKAFSFW